jgi:4-amino-4-deoxy-L-arabinose transferase-like glycosyltransferase
MRADRAAGATGWWLAAGVAAGLAALSKYSALFLGPGVLCWLVWTPERRAHLRTAGPWIALLAAGALFSLNVAWNSGNHWESFARQFGRIAPGRFAPRFLMEFLFTQALLLNPALTAFLVGEAWRRREGRSHTGPNISLFVISSLPFFAYLVIHSLHDRVQAHWPAPLYPAAALVAALAAGEGAWRRLRWAPPAMACAVIFALAVAVALPPAAYRRLPDIALPVRGWTRFATALEAQRKAVGAAWVGTSSYGLAAQLADEPGLAAPILQISERARWRGVTLGPPADLGRPGLVVDLPRRLDASRLRACFAFVRPLPLLARGAPGERPKLYAAFLVAHPLRDIAAYGCL